MPDSAAWVGYITVATGNDMYVQMEDGLAGGFAAVDADVVTVGTVV
jgi:hypothetical protein